MGTLLRNASVALRLKHLYFISSDQLCGIDLPNKIVEQFYFSFSAFAIMSQSRSDVPALVDRFNMGLFRDANGSSTFSRGARHGAAEQGRTRARSRDRRIEANSMGPNIGRTRPAGPMENQEWLDALSSVSDRVATLERIQRSNAQTSGALQEESIRSRASITAIQDDLVEYKKYVETTFHNIDGYVNQQLQSIRNVINGTVNDQFNAHEQKLSALQASYESLMGVLQARRPPPQEFNLTPQEVPIPNTPTGSTAVLPGQQPLDPFMMSDPWGQAHAQPSATHPQVGVMTAELDQQGRPLLPPPMPASFAPGGAGFQSPFETHQLNGPATPPVRPAFVSPVISDGGAINGQRADYGAHAPMGYGMGPPGQYSSIGATGPYGGNGIGHVQTTVSPSYFDISYKPNEALRKFDGDSSKYKMWNSRLKDHLARSNGEWKNILCKLEVAENPITKQWLMSSHIHGNSAWDLATKLETFVSTWVNDTLYGRRVQMAGGKTQEGNGFEIWRQLYLEHHGGANAVQLGGMRRLQEWPKCSSIGNLNQHLDAWLECLETHNQELLAAPNVLRTMLLGVIPTEFEDEILVRPEVVTYRDIIAFCKNRTIYRRQKALAEITRRSTQGRINSLTPGSEIEDEPSDEKMPSWASMIVNSIAKLGSSVPAPPPPVAGAEIAAVQRERQAARKPMANGRKAFNLKFRFSGCWHCGEEGHSRKANPARQIKGCPKFEALKARNGGNPPVGYKGAYEKARDLAWEKFRAATPRKDKVNSLEDTDDDDDSDIGYDDDGSMFALRSAPTALPPKSFADRNPFEDLDDEEEELSDDLIDHFSKWAKVKAKKQKSSMKSIQVSSLQDLDEQIATNPKMFAATNLNTRKLQQSMRKVRGLELGDDEILALVDTGSSIHAADADVHFPAYSSTVRRPSRQRSAGATTAGGHKLEHLGKFSISADTDGQTVRIPFNHMKVKLPILSVRQMMSKGGKLTLTEHGGKISNSGTGQSINFVIHDDLWYVKLKVNRPPASESRQPHLPFGRQGSA